MDFLDPALKAYSEQYTSPESDVLAELNHETNLKVLYPRMLSGHFQGRFLSTLSRLKQPRHILEIGTYTGYSAICLAEGLAPGGKLTSIELDPERAEMILHYWKKAGIDQSANLIIGDAGKVAAGLEGPFDLVFLDADKESYVRYYEMVIPKLTTGGLIIADNMLWSGRVLDNKVQDKETRGLREFVQHVDRDRRVDQILVPIRDGMMLIIKN
jgi:predicted O-methyltransferase YrrM